MFLLNKKNATPSPGNYWTEHLQTMQTFNNSLWYIYIIMHMWNCHTFRLLRAGAKLNKMPGTHVLCRFLNFSSIIFPNSSFLVIWFYVSKGWKHSDFCHTRSFGFFSKAHKSDTFETEHALNLNRCKNTHLIWASRNHLKPNEHL